MNLLKAVHVVVTIRSIYLSDASQPLTTHVFTYVRSKQKQRLVRERHKRERERERERWG